MIESPLVTSECQRFFWTPTATRPHQPVWTQNRNNSRFFVTSYNGAGRCFPTYSGSTQPGSLIPPRDSGGMCSNNYFVDDGLPHLYAAVVDRRGATVYRDPSVHARTYHPRLSATLTATCCNLPSAATPPARSM